MDDFNWSFKLKKNIKCENGEVISPQSFKRSIQRSILIFEKKGGVPILSSLAGFKTFIDSNKNHSNIYNIKPIEGISFEGDFLKFKFDKKMKSGFLQMLSFSPFGYICQGNFTEAGDWRDDSKFISSGPYQVEKMELGKEYVLARNPFWLDFQKGAPDKVIFTHDDSKADKNYATIIDAFTNEYQNEKFIPYRLVPEYINSVLIGNLESGFFKEKQTRARFKKVFDSVSEEILPLSFGVNSRSNTFYPSQSTSTIAEGLPTKEDFVRPSKALLIEGDVPIEGTSRWFAWKVLKTTLERLKLDYKFAKNKSSFEEITNRNYDLRIRGSSIGGGVEAWGLYVCFCSSMGINFPDPQNKVCNLISECENNKVTEEELAKKFLEVVAEEAAILPVSHYGDQLFLSESVVAKSFSPLLAIFKFDQMEIQ
ncbi:MAG: hypothetical protein H7235_00455 [Bdellovibrionaceae bacterium]|nr:hypothetical protein [Pseudobdellovibrionaceae bacterium]